MVTAIDRAKDEFNLEEPIEVTSPEDRLASLRIDEKVDPDRPEIDYSKEEFTVENQRFYLPKDKELRGKILDARDDIDQIIIEMQKLNKQPGDINFMVNQYLKDVGLTRAQVSGKFPEPETDFFMALTQGANNRVLDILNTIVDVAYVTSPAIIQDQFIKNQKQELPDFDFEPGNEKIKKGLYDVFVFLNQIDPSFTPDTFAERVADNMGSFMVDSIPVTAGLTKVTSANKLQVTDPEVLKGVYANAKNNMKMMYNTIIDIYDTAKKEGRLGRLVADDILAAMGFSGGMDVSKKLTEEGAEEGFSLLGTPFKLATETLLPFVGAGGFQKIGSLVYDVPVATFNSTKNFFNKWSEFNQANPDTNPANNLIKMFNERNSETKAQKIAEEISTNINPSERAAREESLDLENRINTVVVQTIKKDINGNEYIEQEIKNLREVDGPSLDFSLAQATENPSLLTTQLSIESNLVDGGFKIITPGRANQKNKVAQTVKDLSLSNYQIVDEALEREFPNTQFIYTTAKNADGKTVVVATEQKIGNFGSYFNTNNRVGGVVDQQIDDELQTQTNILTPGATIKVAEKDLTVVGTDLRNKYLNLKEKTRQTYDDDLIRLVDDSFGDRNFDITDFKDTVITKVKPDFGTRKQDIPDQFYAIRDLGNDFAPIIDTANKALTKAYEDYLSSPTTTNYKTYMEKVKSIEKNLENQITNLNKNLQSKLDAGDIAIAPTYNMGEITFTYPGTIKFDNQGKVIAGIDDLGKTYMGRDLLAGEPIGIGVAGNQVTVDIKEPTLDIPIKQLIKFKEGLLRDLNIAMQKPNENSELIKKLSIMVKEVDGVVDDNLAGIQAYDEWLKAKQKNYIDIFEKGQINKILTQTGTGEYAIQDELVGKAFLTDKKSIDEFFNTFGDDVEAVKGIESAFYDMLFSTKGGVLNKDGLIDINKLKNFRANNADMIAALDSYIPIQDALDSQIKLGVHAANRIKVMNDRKKFADYIELDNFVQNNELKTGLTYKNSKDLVTQALKDPQQMNDIVKALSNSDNKNLLPAFKNQIFDAFLESAKGYKAKTTIVKGGQPEVGGMTKFLNKNEEAIRAFYEAQGDPDGFNRLLDITKAYYKLNLTGYPRKIPNAVPDKIQQIFGTGIPQILSRVFAVQSGRTSTRFISAELGMRFMEKLSTAQREKIIAGALYDKNNAEALLKMFEGKSLNLEELNIVKGLFGRVYGLIGSSVQDEIEEQQKGRVPYGYDVIEVPVPGKEKTTETQTNQTFSNLNIPNVSPASSLSGINMAAMTNATTPNTLARGQAVFGATDPIFGGINSVA